MRMVCGECHEPYDDAECSTICPHRLIMPREDLERKKAGIELLGKLVRFRVPLLGVDNEPARVQACGWNGMLTIERYIGEFAPHLFEVVESEGDRRKW